MTHLRQRGSGPSETTWLSIGVRGKEAARIVEGARLLAAAGGVTFGSLVMEALAQFMDRAVLEAQATASETTSRE